MIEWWFYNENMIVGTLMTANENVLPLVTGGAWKDNCVDILCDPRFLHPMVSKLKVIWKRLPVKWDIVLKEWGAEERGMINRIPPGTWESCHDRRIALELKHFMDVNYHVDKQEKVAVARVGEAGQMEVGCESNKWVSPTTMGQVHQGILNYRSVQQRYVVMC